MPNKKISVRIIRVLAGLSIGLAGAMAHAQASGNGQIIFETSTDGINWAGGARTVVVQPGQATRLDVRVRVRLQNASGVIGFAGTNFQPTVSNWNPAIDTRLPFSTDDGRGVDDAPGVYGRIKPFDSSGMSTGSASGVLTSFVDNGNTLRFAGANQPTTTTGRWGIGSSQLTQMINGTNFNPGLDVVVFKYGLLLGAPDIERTLVASVPLTLVNLSRLTWYTQSNGLNPYNSPMTQEAILDAQIRLVIPSPGALGVFGGLGIVLLRRRHRL
jgi:hypothetical protein